MSPLYKILAFVVAGADISRLIETTFNPAAEAFKTFDEQQQTNLIGNMQLDSEEEPRRGASRANSVRFDESALLGSHYSSGARTPGELVPVRTNSSLSSHPLTERSYSHRSEGRHSSMSHHSMRTNSMGLESSRLLAATSLSSASSIAPPPGLFLLGSVPCIIRCWLDANYSNNNLLYAAVCTASYRSSISVALVEKLGAQNEIVDEDGMKKIKLPIALPEATISQPASGAPSPQLPTISVSFVIRETDPNDQSIQVIIGSDILKTQSADILFSQDKISIYDDYRNLVSIPFVRPEDDAVFKDLFVTSNISAALSSIVPETRPSRNGSPVHPGIIGQPSRSESRLSGLMQSPLDLKTNAVDFTEELNAQVTSKEGPGPVAEPVKENNPPAPLNLDRPPATDENPPPETPSQTESSGIWGSWRRDAKGSSKSDAKSQSDGIDAQRTRPRGMKVLKPAAKTMASSTRGVSNASVPATQSPPWNSGTTTTQDSATPASATSETSMRRFSDALRKTSSGVPPMAEAKVNGASAPAQPAPSTTGKQKSSNPVGGASAFGWLN